MRRAPKTSITKSVKVPVTLLKHVEQIALRDGTTFSQIVKTALIQFIRRSL